MADFSTNNKRIAKNTMFLYIRMFFTLIVSLYTSRVVLNTLGVVDYGVYNTVAGFVTMFAFLNATLSASMQRFYNFESARIGLDGFKKVYSSGIIIHVIVALLILILLETFGLWYVNNVMVIPPERLFSANVVYQLSLMSLCLIVMMIPFSGAVMAAERMDFYAIISILDVLLRLICILALPYLPYDKLITYGILYFLISVINITIYFIYTKLTIFKFKYQFIYDKCFLKQLLSFSGWNIIGTFAFMLKGQALNMLLNVFFGPVINAARGIAYQISNAINSFSSNISVAYKPQIVKSYSQGDNNRVTFLFISQSKICFALIAMLICPVIIDINYILKIWLGQTVPQYTAIFTILVLIDSLICTLNAPCTQVVFATGNIKKYQIASSCVNLLLLPICWLFLYYGFNATSTFIITIVFSIFNQIICLNQLLKVFSLNIKFYLAQVIYPCLFFIILCPLPGYIINSFMIESFGRLLVISGISVIWGITLIYFLLLKKNEQEKINSIIKQKRIKCQRFQ